MSLFPASVLWAGSGIVTDTLPVLSVYLTFDDGPTDLSCQLDSIVRRDSIPITIFLVGGKYVKRPVNDSVLAGYYHNSMVEIQNHSYSHANDRYKNFYRHPDTVVADILLNERILQLQDRIVRLPGRNTWRMAGRRKTDLRDADPAADSLQKLGFSVLGWDLLWDHDSTTGHYLSAEEMIRSMQLCQVVTPGHLVILGHDWMFQDPMFREQLHRFILLVKARADWRFALISQYPGRLIFSNR